MSAASAAGRASASEPHGVRSVLIGALALLASCGYRGSGEVQQIQNDQLFGLDQTTTTSTTTTTTTTTTTIPTSVESVVSTTTERPTTTIVVTEPVQLFFLDGDQMVPIQQNLSSPTTLRRVLDALEAGPPGGEAGIGLRTALPRGVINSASVAGGVATVDLSPDSYERIRSDEELPAIAQIVFTLTRQSGIGQVRFTLDGTPLIVRRGNNLVTEPGEPVSADEYADLLEADVAVSVPDETPVSATTTSTPIGTGQ